MKKDDFTLSELCLQKPQQLPRATGEVVVYHSLIFDTASWHYLKMSSTLK